MLATMTQRYGSVPRKPRHVYVSNCCLAGLMENESRNEDNAVVVRWAATPS
jgi:hypothetical protein